MKINTAGDLRGFLADVLVDIKSGAVNTDQANAISKVAAQITQSLAVEVNTALQLQRMGEGEAIAGSMLLRSEIREALPPSKIWCDQCDAMVAVSDAASCKSKYCKVNGSDDA